MFADLKESRFLGKQLFKRDIKGMFRQSVLGITWAIFPPFLSAGLWVFLNYSGAVNITETGVPYPIFVMCGTVLFTTFTHALNMPADAVTAGKSIMAKLNFPREALLINAFYKVLFDFGSQANGPLTHLSGLRAKHQLDHPLISIGGNNSYHTGL
jgi:lipopolysaccharide transport system permease protein